MTRSRWITSLLAVVLFLSAGATELVSNAMAQDEGDRPVLRFGVNAADLSTLDPHFASGTQDRTVVDMVFNGLVRYVPGNSAEIEPDIAVAIPEPEIVDGKQVWTFELRDDVMCHPGPDTEAYPLTADDVVYSLQKSADTERSAYAGEYAGMTVEKVDDHTVTITMDNPLSSTLFLPKIANYAGGFIVCQQAVEAMGDEGLATHPVGTGPFMFESYTPQNSVVLTANDDYFRGAPKLGGVEVRYMPDTSSRELGLQSGELDAASGLSEAQWVERINAEGNLIADVFGVGEAAFINLNVTQEPLDDPLVRQAIALAVNRDEHTALYGEPVAENIYSVVPAQLMPGGLTQEEAEAAGVAYEQDIERARELLAEAGYPDGFSMDLITSEMAAYRANYEVLQAELAEIGITLNLNVVDHATMHEQIRENVNPIVIYVAYRPNADVYLTNFFHSDSIVGEGVSPITNFSHYAEIDDLIEQARAETDPAAQEELWKQANIQILEDVAAVPLHFQNQVYARTPAVDYGHELISSLALYPQITEQTTVER
ncbi:MAG: polyamine ABC transporter substrate-binding protein [Chloroflexi bacterium]|nr:polyamine ABC transporter substrate-binding protein [Chloroflexota bacterium]